ncbi:hypothetical protein [Aquimarina celericrescens]|uniref:Secreted protein n=1 Tax=Aquimarina celericrescens TaxID=1964542 RepID=A0ABW5B048_9FLAO|nr:hypothetical protein [Aquimarina celericrescens]
MKKLTFLLIMSTVLFSCEAESFDEKSFTPENDPIENPSTEEPVEIIDELVETDSNRIVTSK